MNRQEKIITPQVEAKIVWDAWVRNGLPAANR